MIEKAKQTRDMDNKEFIERETTTPTAVEIFKNTYIEIDWFPYNMMFSVHLSTD